MSIVKELNEITRATSAVVDVPKAIPAPRPPKWDVFIAYASPDRAVAERLHDLLKEEVEAYIDTRCLNPGDEWQVELPAAIEQSMILVSLESGRSNDAQYQRDEVVQAVELARANKAGFRVIPLVLAWLDGVDKPHAKRLPYGLNPFQRITVDTIEGLADAAKDIIRVRDMLTPPRRRKAH